MDLVQFLRVFRLWMNNTFGSDEERGAETWRGTLAHAKLEMAEIEASRGKDLEEWVDLIMLSMASAIRAGFSPAEIAKGIQDKHMKNTTRNWPDWRTMDPDQPIEHIRD